MTTEKTKDFVKYLENCGTFPAMSSDNELLVAEVLNILNNIDEAKKMNNRNVQLLLSEYGEWIELSNNKK